MEGSTVDVCSLRPLAYEFEMVMVLGESSSCAVCYLHIINPFYGVPAVDGTYVVHKRCMAEYLLDVSRTIIRKEEALWKN